MLLPDGSACIVRPVTPMDLVVVARLHEGIDIDNLRRRFFNVSRLAAGTYVDHVMSSCEHGTVMALGLWRQERLLGLATAELLDRASAEIAFVVTDAEHGLGIATLLLRAPRGRGTPCRRAAPHR